MPNFDNGVKGYISAKCDVTDNYYTFDIKNDEVEHFQRI